MTCNCCLAMKLADHKCREKGLETNCPICCDFLFTSSESVRALPCGHFMHSACFQVYFLFANVLLMFLFCLFTFALVFCFLFFYLFYLSFVLVFNDRKNSPQSNAWCLNILFYFDRHTLALTTYVQFVANLWETCR